eukprot:TRINITY_DN288_c1_g1_i1.p1 TRINITY_DN288_c1_g1~~TRINITY_DN288_c1_g1_i1.p1  ORF type:complete len:953 (-),score=132.05 TRINITY_DN288_c1_g1_i1:1035-3893(-)
MSAIPKLVVTRSIDRPDYELAFAEEYQTILNITTGKSEHDGMQAVVAKAAYNSEAHDDTFNGLLYGILVSPPNISELLFKVARAAVKDRFSFLLSQLRRLVLDKWTKMTPEVHERGIWLFASMIRISAVCDPDALDAAVLALLRHVAVGNVCQANIWLATAVLDMFLAQMPWLKSREAVIPFVVYTYLSIINDHTRADLLSLRDREAQLCANLIRENFDSVKTIGRDLVRLLHSTATLPEIESVFRSVLGAPAGSLPFDLDTPSTNSNAAPISNLRMLLNTKTPRQFFESRLTPEMDGWLIWMMNNVKMGNQNRYQRWFASRFLASPESENLLPELVRFICGFFHPSNSLIASDVIPRWAVIGWLLYLPRSAHAASNVRLALFYDFLFFTSKDSIMNIEPAILVITKSLPKYADMANSLLEFLFSVSETYFGGSPQSGAGSGLLRSDARRGLQSAFAAVISKGVCHQQLFRETLLANALIDARNRDLLVMVTSQFYPDLLAKSPLSSARSIASQSDQHIHSAPQTQTLSPELAEDPPAPKSTIVTEPKAEERGKSALVGNTKSSKGAPSVKPAIPINHSATAAGSSVPEEEDDVLVNWTSAIKSTVLNSSAELPDVADSTSRGAKRKEPDTSPAVLVEPPQKRPKKNPPTPLPSDMSVFKSITEEILLAITGSSPAQFSKALLKLLSSGLFGSGVSDTHTSVMEVRATTAKALIESLAEELTNNDPKQWIFSPEGLPGNKTPKVPFLFQIFSFFYHEDDSVVISTTRLVEALREIEVSIGWRLLCFCVQRANLVTVTLYSKSKKKEAGDIVNNPALMDKDREWFNAQLQKLRRLDAQDDKTTSESMFSPYESLVDLVVPQHTERPAALIKDARACAEASVPIFLELAPSLLRFLSDWAAEEAEFVKLLCFCATPAQLTSICQRVSVGEVRRVQALSLSLSFRDIDHFLKSPG